MVKKIIIVLSFVGMSFLVLIFGGGYICGYDFFKKTNTYSFVVKNCKGFNGSVLVFVNGCKVGRVTDVAFDKKNFTSKVYFIVDRDITLTENSSIAVESPLFGDKSLNLNIGDGSPLKPGAVVKSVDNNVDLSYLMEKLKNVSEGLNLFLEKTNKEEIQKNVNSTLNEIAILLKKLNNAKIANKISGVLENVQKLIISTNSLVDDVKNNPKKYLKSLL